MAWELGEKAENLYVCDVLLLWGGSAGYYYYYLNPSPPESGGHPVLGDFKRSRNNT